MTASLSLWGMGGWVVVYFSLWGYGWLGCGWLGSGLYFSLGVGVASRGSRAVVSASVFLSLSLSIVKVRVVGWWSLFLSGGTGGLSGWSGGGLCLCLSLSVSFYG